MMFRRLEVTRLLVSILSLTGLVACGSLEKEIVVPQPPYDRQLVVECYLEQGKPYRLLLSESVEYLADPRQLPLVNDASVQISHGATTESLANTPVLDSTAFKGYNFSSPAVLESDTSTTYTLEVTDAKGRRVTSTTRFLPFVPIKEISWSFNDREKAYLTIRFDDNPATKDYYRFVITRDSLSGEVETNFTFEDQFSTNNEITLGTGYEYEDGDTIIVSLFHIDKPYYDFLESANDAAGANGNPFAQPVQVKSAVQGGIGIFTTLVYDRKTLIIKKTQ